MSHPPDDMIAAYYRQAAERARALIAEIAQAQANGSSAEIEKLQRALERAYYVGD